MGSWGWEAKVTPGGKEILTTVARNTGNREARQGGLLIVREILFLTDAKADGAELTENGREKRVEEHYWLQREWTLKK